MVCGVERNVGFKLNQVKHTDDRPLDFASRSSSPEPGASRFHRQSPQDLTLANGLIMLYDFKHRSVIEPAAQALCLKGTGPLSNLFWRVPALTPTGGVVQSTAPNHLWLWFPFVFFLDLPWESLPPSLPFGLSGLGLLTHPLLPLQGHLPHHLRALPGIQLLLDTCMNQQPDGEGEIELLCKLRDLHITVRGPSASATSFIRDITARPAASPPRRALSEGSFDLVSEAELSTRLPCRVESRDQIAASFERCPSYLEKNGKKLSGSTVSGSERVKRAWTAGQWAGAVLAGRIPTPNRTPQIDLQPRFYVVLKASGLGKATVFRSARSYWQLVGELEGSTSVSHSFPSEQEALVYLAGAGISDFEFQP